MGISEINNYSHLNYYEGSKGNKTNKKEKKDTSQSKEVETAYADRKTAGKSVQRYLKDLQKKNPNINIMSGNKDTSRSRNSNSKTDVMIAPSILSQMASDDDAAKKYEKMLADIPGLDRWADSMIHAMTGNEVKYRQVWIDDDGNMGSFCITGPSEDKKRAQEQAKEKKEEFEESIREQKEKYEKYAERFEKGSKDPAESAYFDSILNLIAVDYKA